MGYRDVRYYPGGLERWQQNGLALESGKSAPAPDGPAAAAPPRRAAKERRRAGWVVDAVQGTSTAGLFGAWLAVIFTFGLAYWVLCGVSGHGLSALGKPVAFDLAGLLASLYFSFVTATSVGFGDVVPLGASRVLAVAEAATELLVFGAVVSKFVSRRQEQLVGDIHRLAFEERLSRLSANLHHLLGEFQAAAMACGVEVAPHDRLRARIGSAVTVFAGELKAIHALLYRPDSEPDEAALESILATLDAALGELHELLLCSEGKVERPPALLASLGRISRLAREICGECVPRAYAPALETLMDGIQERARRLDPAPAG